MIRSNKISHLLNNNFLFSIWWHFILFNLPRTPSHKYQPLVHTPQIQYFHKAKKKNKFVSSRWPENLNAKSVFFFFFFFFFWRGAKVNFQVNIHIIIQMVDEFVPSYVPFPMQLLLQSIYLLNICAFMHKYAKLWYFL